MEMNFCRRCGHQLTNVQHHVYKCDNDHILFANASPAVGVLFINDQKEVMMAVRSIDPGKGNLDMPGGFCDGQETYEAAIAREMEEELGITPDEYEKPEFLLSYSDPYEYKGETLPVLAGVFVATLKPGVKAKPADDVAEVLFLKYEDIDQSKIQFPSQIAGLKLLRDRGLI